MKDDPSDEGDDESTLALGEPDVEVALGVMLEVDDGAGIAATNPLLDQDKILKITK